VPFQTAQSAAQLSSVASDGEGFIVTWSETVEGGGTILFRAHVDPEASVSVAQFAAAPRRLVPSVTTWTGERYLVLWGDWDGTWRGMFLDRRGNSIDGEETSWEGWTIDLPGSPADVVTYDGSVRAIVREGGEYTIVEISPDRELRRLGTIGKYQSGSVARWLTPHRILLAHPIRVEGPQYFRPPTLPADRHSRTRANRRATTVAGTPWSREGIVHPPLWNFEYAINAIIAGSRRI
jgi:hypothetical protein